MKNEKQSAKFEKICKIWGDEANFALNKWSCL